MQQRLKPLKPKKYKGDQISCIDNEGLQWIEINRGCKRGCAFCHADREFKEYPIPKIESNKVHIIGEGFLFDSDIKNKIIKLGEKKHDKKVVYYGLSQGIDYRLLDTELAILLSKNRFGIINNKKNWYKGIRIAWDWGLSQEKGIYEAIETLVFAGYKRKHIIVFVLVNWKIDYKTCVYKLNKFKEWGVKIDDCTWECTKRNFIPQYWSKWDYNDKRNPKRFRKLCRDHNIATNFNRQ